MPATSDSKGTSPRRRCLVFTGHQADMAPPSDGLSVRDDVAFAASEEVLYALLNAASKQEHEVAAERYRTEMKASYRKHRDHWLDVLSRPSVKLVCPCTTNLCSCRLLAQFLAKCGGVNMGPLRTHEALEADGYLPGNPQDTFVALDVERSDAQHDSVCEVGFVVIRQGKLVYQGGTLIKPPRSTVTTTRVHGLTWDDLKDKPTFDEVWYRILPWLYRADVLVAHNHVTESYALRACCQLYNLPALYAPITCSLAMARRTWPQAPRGHGLDKICDHLRIRLNNHHRALADAQACAQLVLLARKLPR